MKKDFYNVIGVMSGTSLDGIDLCHVHFELNDVWAFKIIDCQTIPYSAEWHEKLKDIIRLNPSELKTIDLEYTKLLAREIKLFIDENSISGLDAICSHGHTVFHQPESNLTYQIGNLSELSGLTNNTIVCDFRQQDVQLGGQGAPLVPIGDKLLFSEYDFCLNLGGFANVSFQQDEQRIAYDICPVNIVLNKYARQKGMAYDEGGNMARTGKVHPELLNLLNQLDFYSEPPPKSLGIEWVESNIIPLIESLDIQIKDVLRTCVEHIAFQIGAQVSFKKAGTMLVTGGGAYNSFLIESIQRFFKGEIVVPNDKLVEYKEALIFAILGVLRLRNEVNCLKSVTGASHDHSSGVIFKA